MSVVHYFTCVWHDDCDWDMGVRVSHGTPLTHLQTQFTQETSRNAADSAGHVSRWCDWWAQLRNNSTSISTNGTWQRLWVHQSRVAGSSSSSSSQCVLTLLVVRCAFDDFQSHARQLPARSTSTAQYKYKKRSTNKFGGTVYCQNLTTTTI